MRRDWWPEGEIAEPRDVTHGSGAAPSRSRRFGLVSKYSSRRGDARGQAFEEVSTGEIGIRSRLACSIMTLMWPTPWLETA